MFLNISNHVKFHLVRELSCVKAPVHRLGSSKKSLRKFVPEKFCHCSTGSNTVSTSEKCGNFNVKLRESFIEHIPLLTCPVGEVLERGALAAADVALDEDGVGPLEPGVAVVDPPPTAAFGTVFSMVLRRSTEKGKEDSYKWTFRWSKFEVTSSISVRVLPCITRVTAPWSRSPSTVTVCIYTVRVPHARNNRAILIQVTHFCLLRV